MDYTEKKVYGWNLMFGIKIIHFTRYILVRMTNQQTQAGSAEGIGKKICL